MRRSSRSATLGTGVALLMLGGLLAPITARAQTTYTIEVFQDFFPAGVPGFSARFYPGEITVHQGDTIHFTDQIALLPGGQHPQDYIPEGVWTVGGPDSFLVPDPDEGSDAVKLADEVMGTCGRQDDPCVWDGSNDRVIFGEHPPEDQDPPDFSTWVTVAAAPGTTLWANTAAGSDVNTSLVVDRKSVV